MSKQFLLVLLLSAAALSALISCGTSAGRGAAAGAVGGAVVAGPVGAAIGAVGGAIVGAAVGERDAARYGAPPEQGYPIGRPSDTPGYVYSPYTNQLYDVRKAPPGSLILDREANKLFRRP
jgi:hypothetical protein